MINTSNKQTKILTRWIQRCLHHFLSLILFNCLLSRCSVFKLWGQWLWSFRFITFHNCLPRKVREIEHIIFYFCCVSFNEVVWWTDQTICTSHKISNYFISNVHIQCQKRITQDKMIYRYFIIGKRNGDIIKSQFYACIWGWAILVNVEKNKSN